jgi:hypothetical protein
MPARGARVQSKTLTDPFAAVIAAGTYIMRSSAPPME